MQKNAARKRQGVLLLRVCGRSQNQPFCDGSHRRLKTGQKPLKFVATRETNYMCLCKQSKKLPFCDSSHRKLPPHPKVEIARRQRARRRSVFGSCNHFPIWFSVYFIFFFLEEPTNQKAMKDYIVITG